MDLLVVRTDNGYLIKWYEDEEHYMSYEEAEEEGGDVECFARLLYGITLHFGMSGSKHDRKRINITTANC